MSQQFFFAMKFLFSLVAFLLPSILFSQSFVFEPFKTVTDTTYTVGTRAFVIKFSNTTPDSILLLWESTEVNIPSGWDFGLCDWGNCYAGVPGNGTMWPLAGNDSSLYQFHTNAFQIPGTAVVKLFTWVSGNQQDSDTATYIISWYPEVGMFAAAIGDGLNIYPNPATEFLILANNQPAPLQVDLYNMLGDKIKSENLQADQTVSLNVSDLLPGVYFAKYAVSNGRIICQKLIIQ